MIFFYKDEWFNILGKDIIEVIKLEFLELIFE